MCGIAGILSTALNREHLVSMNECIRHRGPDADGVYYDEADFVGLAHRRLSILDLSPAGNQPFYSQDRRYIMVYNGEVYNFREIAATLKIPTATSSDTEVILEAFALKGPGVIQELNGMFSIAIWDTLQKELFLFRDRVGIKPLYYYWNGKDFAFASELKAMFRLPLTKKINQSSISNFLYLGYIPGADTIFHDFLKLRPGHYLRVRNGQPEVQAYWKLEDAIRPNVVTDEAAAKKELKDLLFSSVQYSLISDVPLGVFLSGGVDSSLIAAIAQQLTPAPVKTFSIGFNEGKYNESGFARQVADHIHSDHHEFILNEQDAIEQVEKLTGIYDEPYADSSAIPTLLVSKLARKEVTVALSGDGGDELFMGYGFYYWARRLNSPLVKTFRKQIAYALSKSTDERKQRAGYMFNYPTARRKSHIFSQEQYYFTEREISDLLLQPSQVTIEEELDTHARTLNVLEQQSFFDIKNYLPEELLVKTDRASMQYGLEVRVPLLDHRLVEFAVNLSSHLKLKGPTGKYLLKEVLYDLVPQKIFDRPKWGFAVPLQLWLSKDLAFLLEKYLSRHVVESCGLVSVAKVEHLKQQFLNGKSYLYNRLWALIQLHKWFLQHETE